MHIIITTTKIVVLIYVCFNGTDTIDDETPEADGICHGKLKNVCCANYYLLDGTCKKCPNGTTSAEGDNVCKPCKEGFYDDPNCVKTCSCDDEKCYPLDGSCLTGRQADIDLHPVTDSNNELEYVAWVSYGSLVGLSVVVLAFGLAAILIIAKRRRSGFAQVNEQNSQQLLHTSLDNINPTIRGTRVFTRVPQARKSLSLPSIFEISDYAIPLNCSTAQSEPYLHPYQPLQSGWKMKRPVYDKRKHATVIPYASSSCILQKAESHEIKVGVGNHAVGTKSEA